MKTSVRLPKVVATTICNIKDVLYLENKCDTILLWHYICHLQRWRTHFKRRTWVHWGLTQMLQAKCVKTGTHSMGGLVDTHICCSTHAHNKGCRFSMTQSCEDIIIQDWFYTNRINFFLATSTWEIWYLTSLEKEASWSTMVFQCSVISTAANFLL